MHDVRLANMFYEQRGPLVFSASVHLVLVIVVAIWALVAPDKEVEPFNFELVPPPSGGGAQAQPTLESIKYERLPEEKMPTLDDIKLPERQPVIVEVEMPPEPVVERPQPVVEIEKTEPKPKQMSLEDFMKANPDANKVKNVRTTPVRTSNPKPIDIPQFRGIEIGSLPSAEIASYSQADQDALSGFIAGFKASLKRAVDAHTSRGSKLSALVSCDILANGAVRNVRIIRSSGDAEFDRKVLAGYKRLSSYARPPQALMDLQIEFVQD